MTFGPNFACPYTLMIETLPKLEMVDLKRQYQRLRPEIDAAMQAVIDQTAFINGPDVNLFAQELADYLGAAQVIPCANGTDALQLVLMAYGFAPGSEVIVPSFNYVAAAETVALMGLIPVFTDALPGAYNGDPQAMAKAVTSKTVAIMAVHLFGQCADLDTIMAIARTHNLIIIEDNAQAIGSMHLGDQTTTRAGLVGHVATTSFFPSKNLGCMGDGGAVYTNDLELGARIKMLANHGQRTKYQYDLVGINSRLDTLQAALLRVKLRYLDEFTQTRQSAAARYDQMLSAIDGLHTPERVPYSTHVYHQYTIKVEGNRRDKLQQDLKAHGVPTMVYYPRALHQQAAFYHANQLRLPIASQLCEQVISLPMHSELTAPEQQYVVEKIMECLKQG